MLFRRISFKIALQFTAFVFLLFLINGAIFLIADFSNARRQLANRLLHTAHMVMERVSIGTGGVHVDLPPGAREQVRIVPIDGSFVYSSGIFTDIPFNARLGVSTVTVDGDQYDVLTSSLARDGMPVGYLQIAEINRQQVGDLPFRSFIYLFVSTVVSAITFFVGLYFARRSLRPAEQMVERLEQFTQDASHELRTPIATLSSSLDLALRTKKYQEGIESAKEDLQDISGLVERLLELARLDKLLLKDEVVDLSALLEDAVDRHTPLAKARKVTIEAAIQPKIRHNGDAMLLRQVIGNLLSNAIKFSKPEGGVIHVTLTKDALTIADSGIGIDADALPHIFDRFYQADTSRSNEGYGLGLALVKRIVELHGWSISAKSKEEKGTTFTIRFED